ncbi:MAG: hypothetical protein Kow00120_07360 [Anaerolineae bacterium]
MSHRIMELCLGHDPNRPLMALTTLLFPGWFTRRLYADYVDDFAWPAGKKTWFNLSFDLDLPEDIEAMPWLLDTLAPYPFRASFACIGQWIERAPDVHRRIIDEGHEVLNHTYSHPHSEVFNPRRLVDMSFDEQRAEVERGHAVCVELLGYTPVGFRLPHLEFTPNIYPILRDLGYQYSSSALMRRDKKLVPFQTREGLWELPLNQCPRHPSSVFDTYHAFRSPSKLFKVWREDDAGFFASFRRLIDLGVQTGAYVNVYFDPVDVRGLASFRQMLDYLVARRDEVGMGTYSELLAVVSREAAQGVRVA